MLCTIKLLFLLVVASATGRFVKDDDNSPKLKWAKKYSLEANKISLLSGRVEFIQYWRTSRKSRVDYNHGSSKSISHAGNVMKKKLGTKFEIFPKTTEEFLNKIFCLYKNGTIFNLVEVEEILPEEYDFVFEGKDIHEEREASKFVYKEEYDYENSETRKYVWAYMDNNNKTWIPVKIETLVFDSWLGKPTEHVIWNIINYKEEVEDSVFDTTQYNCTESPEDDEYTLNKNYIDQAFKKFRTVHEKKYKNKMEHEMRRKIFANNLRLVLAHKRRNSTFKVGLNKFSDRTPAEMKKFKGLLRRKDGETGTHKFPYNKTEVDEIHKTLPNEYDLRMFDLVTPAKDQGSCGSCWTFGSTSAAEGALARSNGGRLIRLANQALVDCAWGFDADGCNGGSDTSAFKWMMKYGLPTEEEYGPYLNQNGFCRIHNMTKLYQIKGFVDVTPFSNEALKVALVKHGPLSVSMDTSSDLFKHYTSGIYYDPSCSKDVLDHEVTLVGYGELDGEEYWICKNSWGTDWGIDGYAHISMHNTDCGITTEPTYVIF